MLDLQIWHFQDKKGEYGVLEKVENKHGIVGLLKCGGEREGNVFNFYWVFLSARLMIKKKSYLSKSIIVRTTGYNSNS